jgi:hypothetical protein
MRLIWSVRFCIVAACLATCLLVWFYASNEKHIPLHYLRYISYLGFWTGSRLFHGPPMSETIEVISNIYLVACTAIEGFLIGLFIDFIRFKLGPSGEPWVNKTTSNTREGARNKALNEGSGAVEHRTPKQGDPHFHPFEKDDA